MVIHREFNGWGVKPIRNPILTPQMSLKLLPEPMCLKLKTHNIFFGIFKKIKLIVIKRGPSIFELDKSGPCFFIILIVGSGACVAGPSSLSLLFLVSSSFRLSQTDTQATLPLLLSLNFLVSLSLSLSLHMERGPLSDF